MSWLLSLQKKCFQSRATKGNQTVLNIQTVDSVGSDLFSTFERIRSFIGKSFAYIIQQALLNPDIYLDVKSGYLSEFRPTCALYKTLII